MKTTSTIELTDEELNLINGGAEVCITGKDGTQIVLIPPKRLMINDREGLVVAGKDNPGQNENVFGPKL